MRTLGAIVKGEVCYMFFILLSPIGATINNFTTMGGSLLPFRDFQDYLFYLVITAAFSIPWVILLPVFFYFFDFSIIKPERRNFILGFWAGGSSILYSIALTGLFRDLNVLILTIAYVPGAIIAALITERLLTAPHIPLGEMLT